MAGKERAASDASKSDAGEKEPAKQGSKKLTAAEILGSSDAEQVEIEMPEWGGSVTLRTLSAGEAAEFVALAKADRAEAPIRMLIMSAVNPDDGSPLFTQAALEALKKKSLKSVMRLQKAAMRLNGLDDMEAKVAAAKNA